MINLLTFICKKIFKYKQFNQYKDKKQKTKSKFIINNKRILKKDSSNIYKL